MRNKTESLIHSVNGSLNQILCIFELAVDSVTGEVKITKEQINDGKLAINAALENLTQLNSTVETERVKTQSVTKVNKKDGYVLVEDDETIRKQWLDAAKKTKTPLRVFSTHKEFLSNAQTINKDSVIFIDSIINGETLKGQDVAQFVRKRFGFSKIILQTGLSKSVFSEYRNVFLSIRERKTFINIKDLQTELNQRGSQ